MGGGAGAGKGGKDSFKKDCQVSRFIQFEELVLLTLNLLKKDQKVLESLDSARMFRQFSSYAFFYVYTDCDKNFLPRENLFA